VGDYTFVNIPPGNYDIVVEAPSFSTSQVSGAQSKFSITIVITVLSYEHCWAKQMQEFDIDSCLQHPT